MDVQSVELDDEAVTFAVDLAVHSRECTQDVAMVTSVWARVVVGCKAELDVCAT